MERVIDARVAENLKCRVLAEGANGPTTPDADLVLEKRQDEIFLIPDILCNSGGVVVSYFEWVQDLQQLFWEEEEVTRREYQILDRAFDQMVARAQGRQDSASHRRDGDRRGEGPRRQEHAGIVPVITGLDHVVVLVERYRGRRHSLPDAVRARAGVAKQRRRRRARAVHPRQHDAGTDVAGRRRRDRGPHPQRASPSRRGARQHLLSRPATSPKCIAGSIGWR